MAPAFRIAVLGLGGRIATVLVGLCRTDARLRVAGYVDPVDDRAQWLRAQGVACGPSFADAAALLAEQPEAVFIGSPNHLHLEHLEAALERTRAPVFCEKPVVISRDQTWTLATLLAKHGANRLHVGLVLRSAPLYRQVQAMVDAGRIGRVVSMEANELLDPEHGGFLMRDWRRYRRFAGSHVLEKCCHDVDLWQALIGAPGVRAASFGGRGIFIERNRADLVRGDAARYHGWTANWHGQPDVFASDADIVDHQVAVVEYANGARLSFHTNAHATLLQRRWLICGHRGTLECDLVTGRIRVRAIDDDAVEELALTDPVAGHYGADEQMARDLRATLLDGAPFPVPPIAALRAGLTCMAIDDAQREGTVVDASRDMAKLDALLALRGEGVTAS